MEGQLRKLGVPTKLVRGRVELEGEYVVCERGEVLGSGQTTLLKMFGVAMAEFRVGVVAYYDREAGDVTVVGEGDGMRVDGEGMEIEGGEGEGVEES